MGKQSTSIDGVFKRKVHYLASLTMSSGRAATPITPLGSGLLSYSTTLASMIDSYRYWKCKSLRIRFTMTSAPDGVHTVYFVPPGSTYSALIHDGLEYAHMCSFSAYPSGQAWRELMLDERSLKTASEWMLTDDDATDDAFDLPGYLVVVSSNLTCSQVIYLDIDAEVEGRTLLDPASISLRNQKRLLAKQEDRGKCQVGLVPGGSGTVPIGKAVPGDDAVDLLIAKIKASLT